MTLKTQSYHKGLTSQTLIDQTIGQAFDATVANHPDALALVVRHQSIRWSYQQYQNKINQLAAGLLALGIQTGDRVGIWAPNCYEWCLTQFATAKIGAILVCINPAYRKSELEYALNKVQCKALICAEQFKASHYLKMLQALAPELANSSANNDLALDRLPHLKQIIRMGDAQTAGMLNFNTVMDMANNQLIEQLESIGQNLDPNDIINIQFTSGTTGSPKGAALTHNNILNNGKIVGAGMKLTPADRLCIPVPLYHCFGMVMGNLACITHGSAAVFPNDGFDPTLTLQTVSDEQCTALHGVPTMFIAELGCKDFANYNLSSLRTGIMAGAPCPAEIMNKVMQHMHMQEVLIAYGQTETSPVNHMTEADDPVEKRVSTVGVASPHLEIKIIDKDGEAVAIGQRGEICVKGYAVMRCYWDEPEKTRETIDCDSWLHSGDIGIMDKQGFVEITGRIKDMIIRGGENIYPREIEEFLFQHPNIEDIQVFGIADKSYGETVCAWIKPQAGSTLSESGIKDYCHDQIAHFKIPTTIRFVDEFPMTVTGKIQKYKMREIMEKQ